ncbi:MAG: phage tail protein [Campylobacteraceae bacterium]|jgi:phage protein D|nr:phage tail protein [Campylobacteraceae bacterium]
MVRKPAFNISIGGINTTLITAKNLISISYEDKEGDESDELSLELSGLYEKKPFGTKIEAHIGYEKEMFYCGSFSIQTISKNYSNNTTSIRATSVNFASKQKEKKERTWDGMNLYSIAVKIAEENSLSYAIDESAKESSSVKKIQQNATDLGFLNTLCHERGFMLTIKDNAIMIKPKNAANESITTAIQTDKIDKTFKLKDLIELETTEANRNVYDAVVLRWQDDNDSKIKEVRAGAPTGQSLDITIAKPKSDAEAIEMANAKLKESQKRGITGSFTTIGQEIRTGWVVKIEDVGEFLVKSVSHTLNDSSYTLSCEIEG